jgi:hypothetical protein
VIERSEMASDRAERGDYSVIERSEMASDRAERGDYSVTERSEVLRLIERSEGITA